MIWPVHPDIRRCRDGLERAIRGLTAEVAESRTAGGGWSVADILEHLDLSYVQTGEGVARLLHRGPPQPGRRTARHWVGRLVVVRFGHLPAGRRAPDAVVPRGARFAATAAVIGPHLMVMDQRLREAAERFGSRRPVMNHPILGPFSINDWRRFHWVHTRHHLRQIATRAPKRS